MATQEWIEQRIEELLLLAQKQETVLYAKGLKMQETTDKMMEIANKQTSNAEALNKGIEILEQRHKRLFTLMLWILGAALFMGCLLSLGWYKSIESLGKGYDLRYQALELYQNIPVVLDKKNNMFYVKIVPNSVVLKVPEQGGGVGDYAQLYQKTAELSS